MSALCTDVIITDQLALILQALCVTVLTVRLTTRAVGFGERLRGEAVLAALLTPAHVGEEGSSLETHSVSVRKGCSDTVTTHSYTLNIFTVKYLIN